MKPVFLPLFLLFAVLGGCASMQCPDYYGSGTSCSGSSAGFTPSDAELGAAAGAAAGTVLLRSHPVAGAVIVGAAGYIVGRESDRSSAAKGKTSCHWRHSGTADKDGNMTIEQSTFDCEGGNVNSGNRNSPPKPKGQ